MGSVPKLEEGGELAGKYRVEKPLLEGSMGSVYEVTEVSRGTRRALQLLHPDLASDPELRKRFEEETQVGSRIGGDPGAEVLASGIDEETGAPWLVTELLSGEALTRFLEAIDPDAAARRAVLETLLPKKAPSEKGPSRAAPPSPFGAAAGKAPFPAAQGPMRTQARSSGWTAAVIGLVALGVAGGAGLGAYKLLAKPSLGETPCGKGILALIGSLKSPVTITLYVTRGLPTMDRFSEEASATMRDLEKQSNGKLVFQLVQVASEDEAQRAKEAGLQESAFGEAAKSSGAAMIQRGFCGFAFAYGSEKDVIPMFTPEQSQGLPFWIAGKIREIRARADDLSLRFGVISSKGGVSLGEPSLIAASGGAAGPNMKGIFANAMPFYKLEDIDLRGGDQEIDASLAGVLVLQPDADYTDKELRRIDQFLMRGGKSVAVLASSVSLKAGEPTMKGELTSHGVDRLLDGYGIELLKDSVFDAEKTASIQVPTQGGSPVTLRYPGILLVQHDDKAAAAAQTLDTTFVPFFRLDEVAFPFASTLVPHPEKQPGAHMSVVARTGPLATAEARSPVSLRPGEVPSAGGDAKPRALAVSLDGKIKSAFAGRPGDGISAPDSAPENSRLFVLSSSQFLVNPLARASNPPKEELLLGKTTRDEELSMLAQAYAQKYLTTTILAFKNTLDWASADDATVSCSALLVSEKKDESK